MGPVGVWAQEGRYPFPKLTPTTARWSARFGPSIAQEMHGLDLTQAMTGSIVGRDVGLNPGKIEPSALYFEVRSGFVIDSSGAEGNCTSILGLIRAALSHIGVNILDLPNTMVPNSASSSCPPMRNRLVFGGHAGNILGTTNPQEVIRETLANARLRIDCKQSVGTRCRVSSAMAYTFCGQWNDRTKDIHLCIENIEAAQIQNNRGDTIRFLADIIAHEIMHVWGADESAAQTVEVFL